MRLSKEHTDGLLAAWALPLLLIAFSARLTPPSGTSWLTWGMALLAAPAAVGLAALLKATGPLSVPWLTLFLLPLALPPTLVMRFWPEPWILLPLLAPWALLLVLFACRPRHLLLGVILLALVALAFSSSLASLPPPPEFPPLSRATQWVLSLLVVLPLAFSLHPLLRGTARIMVRTQLILLSGFATTLLGFWMFASAFKTPAELHRHFYAPLPLPRYTVVSVPDPLDEEVAVIRALDALILRLSPPSLLSLFAEQAPLSATEMIRALQVYGLLQRDAHGFHAPEAAFSRSLPTEIDASFHSWIERYRALASFTPEEVGPAFAELRARGRILPIPSAPGRFRLTPQARHPLPSGFRPRQLVLLLDGGSVDIDAYASRNGLHPDRARQELEALRAAGYLQARRFSATNLVSLLADSRRTVAIVSLLGIALLVGFRIPTVGAPLSGLGLLSSLAHTLGGAMSEPERCALSLLLLLPSLGLVIRAADAATRRRAPLSPSPR